MTLEALLSNCTWTPIVTKSNFSGLNLIFENCVLPIEYVAMFSRCFWHWAKYSKNLAIRYQDFVFHPPKSRSCIDNRTEYDVLQKYLYGPLPFHCLWWSWDLIPSGDIRRMHCFGASLKNLVWHIVSTEVEQLSDKTEVIEMNIPQLTNVCDQTEECVNACASRAYTLVFLHDYVEYV